MWINTIWINLHSCSVAPRGPLVLTQAFSWAIRHCNLICMFGSMSPLLSPVTSRWAAQTGREVGRDCKRETLNTWNGKPLSLRHSPYTTPVPQCHHQALNLQASVSKLSLSCRIMCWTIKSITAIYFFPPNHKTQFYDEFWQQLCLQREFVLENQCVNEGEKGQSSPGCRDTSAVKECNWQKAIWNSPPFL